MNQCVFVNTDQSPIARKTISHYVNFELFSSNLELFVVEEIQYPHPDAPEHATVAVIQSKLIHTASKTDPAYPALYNLMIAQQGIYSISHHLPELNLFNLYSPTTEL